MQLQLNVGPFHNTSTPSNRTMKEVENESLIKILDIPLGKGKQHLEHGHLKSTLNVNSTYN